MPNIEQIVNNIFGTRKIEYYKVAHTLCIQGYRQSQYMYVQNLKGKIMATKTTQSHLINDMRLLMGLNADGARNGNGILNDVKALKGEIESINRHLISIDHKLERQVDECEEMSNDIKEIKQKLSKSLDKINQSLADKVSIHSISKVHKTIIAIAATLGALGGIFSMIINIIEYLLL